ncbi:MAG: sensor histidine kinase [Anaerolineae bacterium]
MSTSQTVRVLIADDDPITVKLVKSHLLNRAYDIVGCAADGDEALHLARTERPDVILMDVGMPGMDGIAATERIYRECPTPVVIMTGHRDNATIERACAAGAGAYLVKPLDMDDIERAITIAMARFRDIMDLRERNEELDAFAHTVAHDLKNPLSVLISYAELLETEGASMSAEELRAWAHVIVEKGHEAINIVNELLLLSSLRRRDIVTVPLDMREIVRRVLHRMRNQVLQTRAKVELVGTWPRALGYQPWVEEVWVNYLDNALKYGGHPPRIEVGGILQADGMARYWVRDNGKGIPLSDQERLFQLWSRGNHVRVSGHGLGLSIVRRIVEKLGGYVGVESSGLPGEGALFYFVLPHDTRTPS